VSALSLSPRTGLTWTVLKVHRGGLRLWACYVAVLALALLWAWGPGTDGLVLTGDCHPGVVNSCQTHGTVSTVYLRVLSFTELFVALLPMAVGVYAGSNLIGTELERGTAQLTWTQSVPPWRWLAAKLALPALFLTAGMAVVITLRQLVVARTPGLAVNEWYSAGSFDTVGTAAIAMPLLGLACGALCAVHFRRSTTAAVTGFLLTLAATIGIQTLRPHLWPTRTYLGTAKEGYPAFVGELTSEGAVTHSGARIEDPLCLGDTACMTDHNIASYYREGHPPNHFWPLQLVETGLILALATILTAATFYLLNRRTPTTR
jgi:hypothetical protein